MKKNYFLRSLTFSFFLILLLFSTNIYSQTTYNISDPEDLENETYGPGDIIILADNTYSTDSTIDFVGNGTSDDPITFRAATPGGVIFTGGLQLNIGGDHVVVDGFHWKGGYGSSSVIEFRNGTDYANHSTIQNCAMDGLLVENPSATSSTKHNWIMLYGTYNTVINCSFMNKESSGNMVLVELQYNFEDDPCAEVGHTISNNYFYKYEKIDPSLSNAGDSETIRIGTSSYQMVNSSCTVSNNYFVEADGENEIITNKSKNNTYTNNTFRRSRGSLVLRHGSNATVDGNYFLGENVDGTGGIRIVDSEHTITNNYIQDCITVVDQAKWNNGITFLGGSANNSVACTSTNESSDYQKVENINLSNNTIVNTNAPLFYNEDKGSTDPTGTVNNNLIFFTSGNANLTDVISGDSVDAFDDLGTALTYSGNVYTGTGLGATTTGFTEEVGITATPDDEIFTFSGTGSAGKGADMGSYEPTTDAMVGYGIGACFLNNLGVNITDGDCTIKIPESLTVSSLSTLGYEASNNDVTVTANVSWTALSNDTWITIDGSDTTSGAGSATVSVSVTENVDLNDRVGTVTFTGTGTDGDIIKTLTVTQDGGPRTNLINTGDVDDPVSVFYVSKENTSKSELAINTLDKNMTSVWTADDDSVPTGEYKADGEYIIYNLGSTYTLDFIQFNTTNKSDAFGFQIWVSTTGTDDSDFTMILPTTGELLLTATGTTDFNEYEIDAEAHYVKVIGFGRFNAAGDNRESAWSAIGEIEFFGDAKSLSNDEYEFNKNILVYPVPAKDNLNIKILNDRGIDSAKLFNIEGKLMMEKAINNSQLEFSINIESLSNGTYILNLSGDSGLNVSKMIIVTE